MLNCIRWLAGGLLAMALTGGAAAAPATADDPAVIAISAGSFNVFDGDPTTAGRLEYRSDYKLWRLKPFGGVLATSEGAVFGYAGLLLDVPLTSSLTTTVSLAPGAYHRGDDRDLGHTIEFQAQIELSYRFENQSRLGLSLGHLSNAHLDSHNPGTETLMLTYMVPAAWLFGR